MNYMKTAMLLAGMTALFMGVGFMLGGQAGMMLALIFAAGTNVWAWWNSGNMVLRMHNAREATPQEAPELHEMVAKLAQNADLPMPKVYVIEDDQPNAFATGRSPETAAVAATTGIMRILSYEELAGVMAHELAHIKNRDTLIMTIAATIAGAISMIAQFGFMFRGGGDRQNPLGFIGVMLAVFIAPMAAMLIQMFVSRTREYSADKLGAEICGNPYWLSSALERISGPAHDRIMDSAERNPSTAHMFIINPLLKGGIDNLFSTHPRTESRVRELEKLAEQMGASRPGRGRASPDGPWGGSAAKSSNRPSPWG